MDKAIALSNFFSDKKEYKFKKGQVILEPEQTPIGVYFIDEGFVKVYSLTENGDENIHIFYKEGEFFPITWIFSDRKRPVFYEAFVDVKIKVAPKEEFLTFFHTSVEISTEVAKKIAGSFNLYADRIDNLELAKAYPRLILRLIRLAERFGKKTHQGILIDLPVTHKDIGNSISLTRETISRDIERLEKKGLVISNHDRRLIVVDLEALKTELSEASQD